MQYTKYELLKIKTNNTVLVWKESYGIASNEAYFKIDKAMLNWHIELTNTLEIWLNKGLDMTDGELILAYANLGAVVESWLKFFYSVYYDDYCKNPIIIKNKMVEPEGMKFEMLKNFSVEKLWNNKESEGYIWVDSIQHKRNAIHSFQFRAIGTPATFLDDIEHLYDFVDDVLSHLPPIEDCIESYPTGYKFISPFL